MPQQPRPLLRPTSSLPRVAPTPAAAPPRPALLHPFTPATQPAGLKQPVTAPSTEPSHLRQSLIFGGVVILLLCLIGAGLGLGLGLGLKSSSSSSSSSAASSTGLALGTVPLQTQPSSYCIITDDPGAPAYPQTALASFEWAGDGTQVGYGQVDYGVTENGHNGLPETCYQPWEGWTVQMAAIGSGYDPYPGAPAPDGYHYWLASGAAASSVWWLVTPGTYAVNFYYSSVSLNQNGNCTLSMNSTVIWTDQNMAKNSLWNVATTSSISTTTNVITNIFPLEVVCQGLDAVVVFDAFSLTT